LNGWIFIMSANENIEVVKSFFDALASGDLQHLTRSTSKEIEWIVPGKGWPLAGTYSGHAGLQDLLRRASEEVDTEVMTFREYVAQGDRVFVSGFASGKIKGTNKDWEDDWVFAITVRDGKITYVREYIDTQALAQASS
jgi:uncharacterized protein